MRPLCGCSGSQKHQTMRAQKVNAYCFASCARCVTALHTFQTPRGKAQQLLTRSQTHFCSRRRQQQQQERKRANNWYSVWWHISRPLSHSTPYKNAALSIHKALGRGIFWRASSFFVCMRRVCILHCMKEVLDIYYSVKTRSFLALSITFVRHKLDFYRVIGSRGGVFDRYPHAYEYQRKFRYIVVDIGYIRLFSLVWVFLLILIYRSCNGYQCWIFL